MDQIVKITEIEDRSKSNSHRIDRLEHEFDALNRLATSVEVLATEQKNMYKKIESIDGKVGELEKLPSIRWNSTVGYFISATASAIVAFIVSRL